MRGAHGETARRRRGRGSAAGPIFLVALFLSACATAPPPPGPGGKAPRTPPAGAPTPEVPAHGGAAAEPRPPVAEPRSADPPIRAPDRRDRPSLPEETFELQLVATAKTLLGSPYRYAGGTPRGFDCSGLVSYVFARFGIALPRTTRAQASLGTWIPLDEVDMGDLLFFAEGSAPSHVGMVTSRPGQPLTMVHSSTSRGVVETVVEDSDYWITRLRFARRHR